jgi:hypothetical protein
MRIRAIASIFSMLALSLSACSAPSVAEFQKQGVKPLGSDDLRGLFVGHTAYVKQANVLEPGGGSSVAFAVYTKPDGTRLVRFEGSKEVQSQRYAIRDNKLCVDSLVDSRTYCGSVYKSGSAYVGCDPRYNGKCLSEYTKLVRGDPEKLE